MKSIKYYTRKTHRYLGLFIGIQFLFWAVGGLYFSWTDIDEIHGDHLVNKPKDETTIHNNLLSPNIALEKAGIEDKNIRSIHIVSSAGKNIYQLQNIDNSFILIDAETGFIKEPMSKIEAERLAKKIFKPNNNVRSVEYVTQDNMSDHTQYRGGP
jgi:hypothetical protein